MGMEPQSLLFDALIPSLEEVGARFERGDFFVPEMLIAGRAMAGAMEVLRPLLAETGVQTIGKFVMGTVKGDVHDIGKNLVNIMLEGAGFEVIDLGVQVAPEKFVAAIEEHQPDIVGFSAFLTTTMPMFKANMNALQKAGIRDSVAVMVGGAPVTQEYADAVGRRRLRRRRVGDGEEGQGTHPEAPRPGASRLSEHASPRTRRVAALGDQGGRHRPRPAVLPDRRAHQPDRAQASSRSSCAPVTCRRSSATSRRRSAGGADVLDVNMGVPLTDEAELLAKAITLVQQLTDLPICIDSSVVEALEAGLAAYKGRALVNSITAEDDRMAAILPLVKKYDAAIIALPNDADEIPMESDKRLDLVAKIVEVATKEYGIAVEDIVIDPLAMPIGADTVARADDADDDPPHPRRVRAEHDLRRVQRVVRHARPAHRSAPPSCRSRCRPG